MTRPSFLSRFPIFGLGGKPDPKARPAAVESPEQYDLMQFRTVRHPVKAFPGLYMYVQEYRQRKVVKSELLLASESGLRRMLSVHLKQVDEWTDWASVPVVDSETGQTVGQLVLENDAVLQVDSAPEPAPAVRKVLMGDGIDHYVPFVFTMRNGMRAPSFPYPDVLIDGVPHWTEDSMASMAKAMDDCAQPIVKRDT